MPRHPCTPQISVSAALSCRPSSYVTLYKERFSCLTFDKAPLSGDDLVAQLPLPVVSEQQQVPPAQLVPAERALAVQGELLELEFVHAQQQRQAGAVRRALLQVGSPPAARLERALRGRAPLRQRLALALHHGQRPQRRLRRRSRLFRRAARAARARARRLVQPVRTRQHRLLLVGLRRQTQQLAIDVQELPSGQSNVTIDSVPL